MTPLPPPRPLPQDHQVRMARRILADPDRCAARPTLRRVCWMVLISAQGRSPRQIAPTGGDAA